MSPASTIARYSSGVLLDDRALVEVAGDVVRGRADELDAALLGLLVRLGADERRQERVVDVDHRHPELLEELRREDLHVTREHHEVDVADEELQDLLLRRRLVGSRDRRHVEERHAEAPHVLGGRRVIGDHHRDADGQVAAAVPPQQVEQAVVLLRGEDRHALGDGLVGQRPLERERVEGRRDVSLDRRTIGREVGPVEDDALEVRAPAVVVAELVERDDVPADARDHRRDGGDDARLVAAVHDQTRVVGGELGIVHGSHGSILP